jgi:hypothetical protein
VINNFYIFNINHRHSTAPETLFSIYIASCLNVYANKNVKYGVNDITLDNGDFIANVASQKVNFSKNKGFGIAFGISTWMSVGSIIKGNQLSGSRSNGNRGIKIAGSFSCIASNNVIRNFDSGVKHEDSGKNTVTFNKIMSCGVNTGSAGINFTNQNTSAELDFGFNIIEGNTIKNQIGSGIVLDSQVIDSIVCNNIIEGVAPSYGIIVNAINCKIFNNIVKGFGLYGITFKPEGSNVSNNSVYDADNTKIGYYALDGDNAINCIFNGNQAPNNPINNDTFFRCIGSRSNNYIKSYTLDYKNISSTNGNTIGYIGGAGTVATTNGQSFSFTLEASGKLFTISNGGGQAALIFADNTSATITILANPSSLFEASSTPTSGKIGIYKSAASHVVSIKSNFGSLANLRICALGSTVTTITDPA